MDVGDPTGSRALCKAASEQSHIVGSGSLQPRNYFSGGHIFGMWLITMPKCSFDVESVPGSHYNLLKKQIPPKLHIIVLFVN